MRTSLALGLLVGSASLLSCGGSSEDGGGGAGGGGPSGPAIDELPPLVAEVFCTAMKQCVGDSAYAVFFEGVDCKARMTAQLEDGGFVGMKAAITKGTVAYHPDQAQDCLDAYKAQNCAVFSSRSPGVCELTLEGKVVAGGECTLNVECAGDLYCKVDAACPGKCSPREAAGGACSSNDACESGLVCNEMTSKCEKPGGTGDACGLTHPGCAMTHICLGTDENTSKPGTCRPMSETFVGKLDETCSLTQGPLCASGLSCIVSSIVPLGFSCAADVAADAPCKLGAPDQCPSGQYCADTDPTKGDIDGTCKNAPGEGEACAGAFGGSACATGLACGAKSLKCHALQRIGGVCTDADACYSGKCAGGTCAPGDDCP